MNDMKFNRNSTTNLGWQGNATRSLGLRAWSEALQNIGPLTLNKYFAVLCT